MSNSKETIQQILARIASKNITSNSSTNSSIVSDTSTVTHSNESCREAEHNLYLHLAAYYIMHREFKSSNFILLRKKLCNITYIESYGSSREVNKKLVTLIGFGFTSNIELWEIVQHIFYSLSTIDQGKLCDIIYENYGEISYD